MAFLEQMIFDAAHHQRGIAFTHLGHHDADGEAVLLVQGTRHEVGAVTELARGEVSCSAGGTRQPYPGVEACFRIVPKTAIERRHQAIDLIAPIQLFSAWFKITYF